MKSIVIVIGDGANAISKYIDEIRDNCNVNDTFSIVHVPTNETFDGIAFVEEYLSSCDDICTIGLLCGCFSNYIETYQVLMELFSFLSNNFKSIPIITTIVLNNITLLTGYESVLSLLLCSECLKYSTICIIRTTNDSIELCKAFCENNSIATKNQALNNTLKSQVGYLSVIACDVISIYINNNQQYNSIYPLQNVSNSIKIFDIRSSLPVTYLNNCLTKLGGTKRASSSSTKPTATTLMRNLSNNLSSMYNSHMGIGICIDTVVDIDTGICCNASVADIYQRDGAERLGNNHINMDSIAYKQLNNANMTLLQLAIPNITFVTLYSIFPMDVLKNKIRNQIQIQNESTDENVFEFKSHKNLNYYVDLIKPMYEYYNTLCLSNNNHNNSNNNMNDKLTSGLYGIKKTSNIIQSNKTNISNSIESNSNSNHIMTVCCFESSFSKNIIHILINNTINVVSSNVYDHVLYHDAYSVKNSNINISITKEKIEDAIKYTQQYIDF